MNTISLKRRVYWRYTAKPHVGKCRIDGQDLHLRFRFQDEVVNVPDVLELERLIAKVVAKPATVEELAIQLAEATQLTVIAVGWTETHGKIRVVVNPLREEWRR